MSRGVLACEETQEQGGGVEGVRKGGNVVRRVWRKQPAQGWAGQLDFVPFYQWLLFPGSSNSKGLLGQSTRNWNLASSARSEAFRAGG